MRSAFPYPGGKSRIVSQVWRRFGADVANYVEPCFGSGAVLLGRPGEHWRIAIETVNDACGFIANFWRATRSDPEAVAHHADWPVNENDLHARHIWLVNQMESMQSRLEGDPDWFDAKVAGWWCWGLCCWIGSGWCSGEGPWQPVEMEDGSRQLIHLGNAGRGVRRKLIHLGDAGRGVNRKRIHPGDAGHGVNRKRIHLGEYFDDLSVRLRNVRVCCGDWSRVLGPTPTVALGTTAVFLDPPYAASTNRDMRLYRKDSGDVAHDVREWAIEHGDDPRFRIALCGYEGEHVMPKSWECMAWKARGGYGSQSTRHDNPNARRERVWFSPHCLSAWKETPLFAGQEHQDEATEEMIDRG